MGKAAQTYSSSEAYSQTLASKSIFPVGRIEYKTGVFQQTYQITFSLFEKGMLIPGGSVSIEVKVNRSYNSCAVFSVEVISAYLIRKLGCQIQPKSCGLSVYSYFL